MSRIQIVPTASGAPAAPLTPEQKRFNTLIRQIGQARQKVAAWRDAVPLYAQAHHKTLVPLAQAFRAARREWVFALGSLLDRPGWSRLEQSVLRDLVCDGVADLMHGAAEDDSELKALFDRHSESGDDTKKQSVLAGMTQMAEAMTGFDLGDDDVASDADLFRRMQRRRAAAAAGTDDANGAAAHEPPAHPRRETAAQKRREEEARLATQSVRDVFRRLASALHPDRESDPAQREAKTGLMQQANQAYADNDLLALLELQLHIDQVNAAQVADTSPQRLKHYNKVLAEQLDELKAEADRIEMGFRIDFGLEPGWGLNPSKLLGLLDQHARQFRADLAMQQRDMRMLSDKGAVKRWLKRERRRARDEVLGDFL